MGCYLCGEEEIINWDCFLPIIFWSACTTFSYCCFKTCITKNIILNIFKFFIYFHSCRNLIDKKLIIRLRKYMSSNYLPHLQESRHDLISIFFKFYFSIFMSRIVITDSLMPRKSKLIARYRVWNYLLCKQTSNPVIV